MSVPIGGFSPAFFERRPPLGATIKTKKGAFRLFLRGNHFS
jgi:hypothetical protein